MTRKPRRPWRTSTLRANRLALRRATGLRFDMRKAPTLREKFAVGRHKTKIAKLLSGEYVAQRQHGAKRPVLITHKKSFNEYLNSINWSKDYSEHSNKLAIIGRSGKLIYPQVSGRRWAMVVHIQIAQSNGYYDILNRYKTEFNVIDDNGAPIAFAVESRVIETAKEDPAVVEALEQHS